jgi:hypothetical protein
MQRRFAGYHDTGSRSLSWSQPLRSEPSDHTGKHVSCPSSSQRGMDLRSEQE